jgi:hypothetical protein
MNRVIRIELRRSSARVVAVLLVLVGLGPLYLTVDSWGGQWMTMTLTHGGLLMLFLPLALAAGAWQGRREARTQVRELMGTVARPRWQRATPVAVALATTTVLGYLLLFGICTVWVAGSATYFDPAVVPVVGIGAVAMVAAVWLGMAVGRMSPSVFVSPGLALLGLFALVGLPAIVDAAGSDSGLVLLSPVLSRSAFDWMTVPSRLLTAHAVLVTGLAVAGFLLLAGASWRPRALAGVVVAGVVVTAAALLPRGGADAMHTPNPDAYRLVCTDDAPRVCVTAVHASVLADVTPPARRALALLAQLPGAPTSAQERRAFRGEDPDRSITPDVLPLRIAIKANRFDDPYLVENTLAGLGTEWVSCPTPWTNSAAREAAGAWLLNAPPRGTDGDTATALKLYQELRAFPAAEQLRRVAAVREAALRCEPDLTAVLVGRAGA